MLPAQQFQPVHGKVCVWGGGGAWRRVRWRCGQYRPRIEGSPTGPVGHAVGPARSCSLAAALPPNPSGPRHQQPSRLTQAGRGTNTPPPPNPRAWQNPLVSRSSCRHTGTDVAVNHRRRPARAAALGASAAWRALSTDGSAVRAPGPAPAWQLARPRLQWGAMGPRRGPRQR